jgi:hypothetical protein
MRDRPACYAHAMSWASNPQKRGYDLVRRDRLTAYHHLYAVPGGLDREKCFYCKRRKANTLDHCPSLLAVACIGVRYFQRRSIPFALIPACRKCGPGGIFIRGRVRYIDIRQIMRRQRAAGKWTRE